MMFICKQVDIHKKVQYIQNTNKYNINIKSKMTKIQIISPDYYFKKCLNEKNKKNQKMV